MALLACAGAAATLGAALRAQPVPPSPSPFAIEPVGVPVTVTQAPIAQFADSLFWVGDKLAVGWSDQPDADSPEGNTGGLAWSDTAGEHWSVATQAAGGPLWLPKTALPQRRGGSNSSGTIVLAYELRRFGPNNFTHAYVHGQRLVSSAAGLTQTEYVNATFIFPPTHSLAPLTNCLPSCGAGSPPSGKVETLFAWTTNGNVLTLDSGEMLMTLYGTYREDVAPGSTLKELTGNGSLAVATSTSGTTWRWRSTVAHAEGPAYCHAPNENAAVKLASGAVLIAWRSDVPSLEIDGNGAPLCHSVSTDGRAEAWSVPSALPGAAGGPHPWVPPSFGRSAPWGVMPRLQRLEAEGLLVLTSGRGGVVMWVAEDPPTTWHPFDLAAAHNKLVSPELRFGCGAPKQPGWCIGAGGGYDDQGHTGSVRSTCYTGLAAMPDQRGVVITCTRSSSSSLVGFLTTLTLAAVLR